MRNSRGFEKFARILSSTLILWSTQAELSLGQSYAPGQPIKLHDYGSPPSSQSSVTVPANGATPSLFSGPPSASTTTNSGGSSGSSLGNVFGSSGGNGSDTNRLPDLIPSMDVAPQRINTNTNTNTNSNTNANPFTIPFTTSGGSTAPAPPVDAASSSPNATAGNADSSSQNEGQPQDAVSKRKSKTHTPSGLGNKIKHFAGDVINVAPAVVNAASQAGQTYSGASGNGGGGAMRPGGGGGVAVGGEMGMELNSAIQAEKSGDYYVAAKNYCYTVDLAIGGLGFKQRKDFWEHGKIGPYSCADIYKRSLNCHVIMYRGFLDQGKTWGINSSNEMFAGDLFKDLTSIELCDPQDASWYYLLALNDIAVDKQELAHVRAYWELGNAMQCPNCNAELKAKCEALRDHIRLAAVVELADQNRAKFENMEAQVWGQEHNTVTIYKDSSGNTLHVIDAGAGFYRYYYPLMKEMLKNDYPKFKASYARLLAYVNSLPNHGIAIPPGIGTQNIANFKIKQNEDISYGPVKYRTGGHF